MEYKSDLQNESHNGKRCTAHIRISDDVLQAAFPKKDFTAVSLFISS